MNYFKDVPPKYFTLSAVVVGYLLIDDTTSAEQNALGNWLMLIAQVLCTNAYFKQLQNLKKFSNANPEYFGKEETVEILEKMVNAMKKEIDDLKNSR